MQKSSVRRQAKPLDPLPIDAALFVASLLAWYAQQGRDLPWRNTRDPYRIWLAEIMLQQTTVAAVIDYYQRFLDNFPTLERLAAAPQQTVIDLWAGLGYYSRARNLHATARQVVENYAGIFPQTVVELQSLPGVGRSTAGAIAALAFEQRAPILDGNVRRVLCRLCALQQPARSAAAEKQLWAWSDALTPAEQVHDYTQAIMDLGATVCVPRNPLCEACPVAELCLARGQGLEQRLPLKQARKALPVRHEATLLIEVEGRYPVRRRPVEGFLGGLWEFPHLSIGQEEQAEEKLKFLLQDFGLSGVPEQLGRVQHLYSHFRLVTDVYRVSATRLPAVGETGYRWVTPAELAELALHGAHKKVFMSKVEGARHEDKTKP